MKPWSRILPVVAGALAGGAIALVVATGSSSTKTVTTTVVQPQKGTSSSTIPTSLGGRGLSVNQIYKQASPGVVDILVTSQSNSPFGGGSEQSQGEGAGVVYDNKGHILTDEHVVAGATSVRVRFKDGKSTTATVLGTDKSVDVAVIKVNVPASELHPIPFADSSAAQVGDPVVAIGSPFSLPETTTTGIVSAVGRTIQAPNTFEIPRAIQTDAAINPGNSGGPLLDADGRVLGLVDQINTNTGQSSGVGFAVPSDTVARVANGFISGHPVKHAYVGVSLDASVSGGAGVSTQPDSRGNPPVRSGGPAAQAGIQPGDVITAINGKTITSTDDFIATVDGYAPGDTITVTVNRGGQTKTLKLTLGVRPASATNGG